MGYLTALAAAAVAHSPGPALETPPAALNAALECSEGIDGADRAPVLLVAGTGGTPHENFSWNYMPALSARGIPWCGVTVPDHTLADVQVQAEYLVHAIRTVHRRAGRGVAIVGYSQGGMTPRWPVRWWPGLRPMLDDVVSLAAPNHGTGAAEQLGVCSTACHPAAWQNLPGSELLETLNLPQETFAGISYTQIFTAHDELSTPAGRDGTSPLRTGDGRIANVALQDVCPDNGADHVLIGSVDPVGFALVVDALEHPGPADPARIDPAVCREAVMPGVRLDQAGNAIGAGPFLLSAITPFDVSGVAKVDAPPPLRDYTTRPQVTALVQRGRLRLEVVAGTRSVDRLWLRLPGGVTRRFAAEAPRDVWRIRVRVRGRPKSLRVRIRDEQSVVTRSTLR